MNTPYLAIAIVAGIALIALAVFLFASKKKSRKPAVAEGKRRGKNIPRPAVPRADGVVEIYVGNLSYDVKDPDLRAAFAKFGVVNSARVITRRPDGKSKGFGFVEMPHRSEAEIAIAKLNNTEIMGRRIHCNEARMDSRPNR